jgi:hypothetical protein
MLLSRLLVCGFYSWLICPFFSSGGSSRAKAMTASANNDDRRILQYTANRKAEFTKYSQDVSQKKSSGSFSISPSFHPLRYTSRHVTKSKCTRTHSLTACLTFSWFLSEWFQQMQKQRDGQTASMYGKGLGYVAAVHWYMRIAWLMSLYAYKIPQNKFCVLKDSYEIVTYIHTCKNQPCACESGVFRRS